MRFISTLGCLAAIIIGFAAMSVDTWSNIEFQAGKALIPSDLLNPAIWNSLTAAVVVVAIATAAALTFAGVAWRRRQWGMAIGLFLAFLCGTGYSLSATLDRVSTAKDGRVHVARSHNLAIAEASAAVTRWQGKVAAARVGINEECDGRTPANLDRKSWPKCRGFDDALKAAVASLADAEAKRASLGAEVTEDSGADRIAALIPGLSPQQVTLYQPVLLPVALYLFGTLLVAYGFGGLTPVREPHLQPVVQHREMKDITPVDPVVAALQKARGPVNNGELAKMIGQSDATTHRRVLELSRQGKVLKARAGREVAITLA